MWFSTACLSSYLCGSGSFLIEPSRAGFSPREETITEALLVEMKDRARGQVKAWKSTSSQETDLGLDFAWAVEVRPAMRLRMVVQAKKLDSGSRGYRELISKRGQKQARDLTNRRHFWQLGPPSPL